MSGSQIKTFIQCENIAPLVNLNKEITSSSLKFGIFANNGSGKTFLSRLFRLTEAGKKLEINEDGICPTDKLITLGKNVAKFHFKVVDKNNNIKEDFDIQLTQGNLPDIPQTNYIYHTFNQDYIDENIRDTNYDKDSQIEGYILGKVNIDLHDEEEKLQKLQNEGKKLTEHIVTKIKDYLNTNINNIQFIKKLKEYELLNPTKIFDGTKKELQPLTKQFDELLEDYNKIKSVPENLNDISSISQIEIDLNLIETIQTNCLNKFSISNLAEVFKKSIKAKQEFVENGMSIIEETGKKNICPFCGQILEKDAKDLIDRYTEYLQDTEAQTIKQFKSYINTIQNFIKDIEKSKNENIKRTNDYNKYKLKYIPSCENEELNDFDTKELIDCLQRIINNINNKITNISSEVIIDDEIIQTINKKQTLINDYIATNNKKIGSINNKKNSIGNENKGIRKEICKCAYYNLVTKYKSDIETIYNLKTQYDILFSEVKKKKEQQKVRKKEKVASTIRTVLNYFFADKYTLDENSFRLIFHKNILGKGQAKDILSEGEKNIIAFAYFIGDTHLKIEREDDYSKVFFIIDDPISSMDFSYVYTLCGVIRNIENIIDKIKMKKFIIFTHNNDFMRILSSNNILDKRMLLRNNELKDFNINLTVPYIHHLQDIYNIARKNYIPNHTTANSIRHIIETLTKFEKIQVSSDSIAEYIKENIPDDTKSYTLINDLSHGGWRSEQAPITDEDYRDVCETIIKHIENKYIGQIEYCKKQCETNVTNN